MDVNSFIAFMSGVGGVDHNLTCSPQGPGGVQVLERLQIAADHLLSRGNDTMESALVLGSGSRVPDCDGGGEDGVYVFGKLNFFSCRRKYVLCWVFLVMGS